MPRQLASIVLVRTVSACLLLGGGCSSTPNGGDAGANAGSGSSGGAADAGPGGAGGNAGATAGMAGSEASGNCTFSVTSSTSPTIPTVGIVTWSTSLVAPTEAHIDFGLTAAYGMAAPVDLTSPGHRTLLLGMKPSHTYHFRVEATAADGACTSDDHAITTGPVMNGLATVTATVSRPEAAFGGFLLTGQYVKFPSASGVPAYILDADGDVVWWYLVASDASCVRMTHDAGAVWINGVNVPSGAASVHRVSMDGLVDEDLSSQFVGLNHQLTVLPDETIVFDAYGANGCDDIKQRAPDGTVTTVVNAQAAHGGTGACHVNAIAYSKTDDTLVFSDLDNNDLTKITRTGITVWVLNGVGNTFSGDSWQGGQHGIDILGPDDLVIFTNNDLAEGGTATGSSAIEMKVDLEAMTATRIWSYLASPAIQNNVMGDVQRLPNGNTVVAYSVDGLLDEVDATAGLVQEWRWSPGATFGYIEKRATLYGPPPR